MPDFNAVEQEIIVLKAASDSIHDMVNYEMFLRPESVENMNFIFLTMTHQEHYNALLGDFLSPLPLGLFNLPQAGHDAPMTDRTLLFHMKRVADRPCFNPEAIALLRNTIAAFIAWLETEFTVEKVWLPSINVETALRMKRIRFIKICGNITKHSFARMDVDAGKIQDILRENGHDIDDEQKFMVIPDFHEWFHHHIFGYHASTIAEFLNNMRWGIREYLSPTYRQAVRRDDGADPPRVWYETPPHCHSELATTCFWGLMNATGRDPIMPRYQVTEFLKLRY